MSIDTDKLKPWLIDTYPINMDEGMLGQNFSVKEPFNLQVMRTAVCDLANTMLDAMPAFVVMQRNGKPARSIPGANRKIAKKNFLKLYRNQWKIYERRGYQIVECKMQVSTKFVGV